MALRLELKQGQSLVMTPQLQQSIKLLQLSNIELDAVIESELAENPLLERDSDDNSVVQSDEQPASEKFDEGSTSVFEEGAEPYDSGEPAATLGDAEGEAVSIDLGADDFSPGDDSSGGWSLLQQKGSPDPDEPGGNDFPAGAETLNEHLLDQLSLVVTDDAQRLIGMHLIDMVDEAGYFRGEVHEIAERLNAPDTLVEETLAILQTFDPAGVCARNLPECLKLQLQERGHLDPMIATLLDHLDLVAAHDYVRLSKLCGADEEDIQDMLVEIRSLNPKPGLKFGGAPVVPIVPDVFVRALPDGGWHVELNSETLPRLLVNRSYCATVRARASADERKYLTDCLNSANWLIKSLDQRAQTILKVAKEIVKQQEAFFRHGVQGLKPMVLRDVAETINMHESTVSRATAHKYMATPRGLFEFKYFFSSAIAASDSAEAHSSEAVRHRIKQLIDRETPDAILSDDQIVALLKRDGVDIARRTVAKYRDIMGIPSSRERRRAKKMMAVTAH